MNCTEKFVKHSERVGARFAELNAGAFNPADGACSHLMNYGRNDGWQLESIIIILFFARARQYVLGLFVLILLFSMSASIELVCRVLFFFGLWDAFIIVSWVVIGPSVVGIT
jgi:biotin transporter BioY